MHEEENIVEIIPPFTPDLAAKAKQDNMVCKIKTCEKHLLRGAENLCQVILYWDFGTFEIVKELTGL